MTQTKSGDRRPFGIVYFGLGTGFLIAVFNPTGSPLFSFIFGFLGGVLTAGGLRELIRERGS